MTAERRGAGPLANRRAVRQESLSLVVFGTYDRNVGRNAILAEGLREAGVRPIECWAPLWRNTEHKLQVARSARQAIWVLGRWLFAWQRLVRQHRALGDYDVMLVGPTAHLDLPLARFLSRRREALLLFDPLVSIVETILDRDLLDSASSRLTLLVRLERYLFGLPDVRLADTTIHRDAMATQTLTSDRPWWVIPASAPSLFRRLAAPYQRAGQDSFRVLYFGQYIPLHGLETVLAAAHRLHGRPDIQFELVGTGQTYDTMCRLAAELGLRNVHFISEWLRPERLAVEHIRRADVCLGVFGQQPKAARVVPQKIYAALASGRTVITADTPAVHELLTPGDELWTIPAGDAEALAAAIGRLADQPALVASLARRGQEAYDRRFAPAVLGAQLRDRIFEHLGARATGAPAAAAEGTSAERLP